MPIFEYRCLECGHVMEVLHKAAGKSNPTCEKCGSGRTEKLLSGFAVGKSRATSAACEACPSGPEAGGMCGGGGCCGIA